MPKHPTYNNEGTRRHESNRKSKELYGNFGKTFRQLIKLTYGSCISSHLYLLLHQLYHSTLSTLPHLYTSVTTAIMTDSNSLPTFLTNTDLDASFDKDIKDTHLIYDYAAQAPDGTPEKWRYEMWFFSSNRIVCKLLLFSPTPSTATYTVHRCHSRRSHGRSHQLPNLHIPMHSPR